MMILRVKCSHCGTTHALIPAFSLPDTSIGTAEAEVFLQGRFQGESRRAAGKSLLKKGMSQKYLIQLERMLNARIAACKAIIKNFSLTTCSRVGCLDLFLTTADRPIFELNVFCLLVGFNAVFCSRTSILLFKKRKTGKCISLNLGVSPP